MDDQIVIQLHLGQNAGPDGDGYVTPDELFWHRGDEVRAYLPQDVPPPGNIMRQAYAYIQATDAEVAARLLARKKAGERMPTESYGTEKDSQGKVLRRSKIKHNLDAMRKTEVNQIDDINEDSPVMDAGYIPRIVKRV